MGKEGLLSQRGGKALRRFELMPPGDSEQREEFFHRVPGDLPTALAAAEQRSLHQPLRGEDPQGEARLNEQEIGRGDEAPIPQGNP